MKSWIEQRLHTLLSINDEIELFKELEILAKGLEFDYCAFGLRINSTLSMARPFIANNYPDAWRQQYESCGYIEKDPTVGMVGKTILPFVWTEGLFAQAMDLWEDARKHGLQSGWAQPCYDSKFSQSLLTLARSGKEIGQLELAEKQPLLSFMTCMAHEGMSKIVLPKINPTTLVELTAREKEVLRWLGDGLTASEVGEKMFITERTVKFHLSSAMQKLGVNNKTAAVIRALTSGLI